jgi:hypothetical protein
MCDLNMCSGRYFSHLRTNPSKITRQQISLMGFFFPYGINDRDGFKKAQTTVNGKISSIFPVQIGLVGKILISLTECASCYVLLVRENI